MACIYALASAGVAGAEPGSPQIEVIRGAEKTYVSPDSSNDPRIQEQNGVEKVYGVEPGTGRIGIETDRFTIEASERTEVRRDIRELIRLYDELLGVRVSREFRVDLELLGDRRRYDQRYRGDHESVGFYRPSSGETVISADGDRVRTRNTMIHEASHAVLGDRFTELPMWLNEGLSEYFERLRRTDRGVQIPVPTSRKLRVAARLRKSGKPGLRQMVGEGNRAWRSRRGEPFSTAYELAWSAVAFLMSSDPGIQSVRTLLADSGPGGPSLERSYPGGLAGLERDFGAWLGSPGNSHVYE